MLLFVGYVGYVEWLRVEDEGWWVCGSVGWLGGCVVLCCVGVAVVVCVVWCVVLYRLKHFDGWRMLTNTGVVFVLVLVLVLVCVCVLLLLFGVCWYWCWCLIVNMIVNTTTTIL